MNENAAGAIMVMLSETLSHFGPFNGALVMLLVGIELAASDPEAAKMLSDVGYDVAFGGGTDEPLRSAVESVVANTGEFLRS